MQFLKDKEIREITEEERRTAFDYFTTHPVCSHLYQKENKEEK
jgi:hypothetical protein